MAERKKAPIIKTDDISEGKKASDAKNEENLMAFLYSSITDIQNTIRAIDTKISFLLVALGIPVGALGKIFTVLLRLHDGTSVGFCRVLFWCFVFAFSLFWILGFVAAFMALISISNPRKHVKSPPLEGGAYFRGGHYELKFIDRFANRSWFKKAGPMSDCSLAELIEKSPRDSKEIVCELVFEQMKLAYIRDTKIFRQNTAYLSAAIWLGLGFLGWISELVLVK